MSNCEKRYWQRRIIETWPAFPHLITGVLSAMIALINLSTNSSDTRHTSADITHKSPPSDALPLICHYWSNAARKELFCDCFFAAALWRQSEALLHHNGPAQQCAVQFSRICDRIIVERHSGLIWDLSLCNVIIQARSTMCLVFRCARTRITLLFGVYVPGCVEWKIDSVLFSGPNLLLFQHIFIKSHNSSSSVAVFAEHLCNFSDNQQSGWSVITAEL